VVKYPTISSRTTYKNKHSNKYFINNLAMMRMVSNLYFIALGFAIADLCDSYPNKKNIEKLL